MKKILITGHNGFLGRNLVDFLSSKHQIIGVSNFIRNDKIKQIKSDIGKLTLNKIPKDISCIIHLAALTDVSYCEKNPAKCIEVNVLGTQKMLDIARKLNSKFIFLSTSHVYDKPKKLPILETDKIQATSIYSASKILAEKICESYANSYGMNISILRLFSVYGPHSSPHLVTTKIIQQCIRCSKAHQIFLAQKLRQ